MNSSSSSKFSNPNPKSRGALCGGSLTCYHGLPAQLRIAKRGSANWPVSAPNSENFLKFHFFTQNKAYLI